MSSVLCTDGNEHRTHGWSKNDACEVPFILEATGRCVSHDNLYIHSHMFTDKPQLTSLLMSFCRINYVCCRFRELKKMECFFLSIRSSISHTYAWPVFYHAPSPKQALPCGWDMLILHSLSVLAQFALQCYHVYSILKKLNGGCLKSVFW